MIRYHVIALLCLVGAGISTIEALVAYMEKGPTHWRFLVMLGVFMLSILVYARARKLRKKNIR